MILNVKEFHREGFSKLIIIILLWIEAFRLKIDFAYELIGTVTAEKENKKKRPKLLFILLVSIQCVVTKQKCTSSVFSYCF